MKSRGGEAVIRDARRVCYDNCLVWMTEGIGSVLGQTLDVGAQGHTGANNKRLCAFYGGCGTHLQTLNPG